MTLRAMLKKRRAALKRVSPRQRDNARHRVKVLERLQQIRRELAS